MSSTTRALHRDLTERPEPWQVAETITTSLLPDLAPSEIALFPKRPYWARAYASSMSQTWQRAKTTEHTISVLESVTGLTFAGDARSASDVSAYLDDVRQAYLIPGGTSFKDDRLNRAQRRERGLTVARRKYDKVFRLVGRLDAGLTTFVKNTQLSDLAIFAKLGFATQVPYRDFAQTPGTAAFVSYYTANLARRSLFTSGKQARAMDKASEMLMKRLDADPRTSWYAVAHVFPRWDVLARVSLDDRTRLLDSARAKLEEIALLLRACVTETMDVENMVVRRGDDSSTWNALAGAWNKARDAWYAVGWSVDPSIIDSVSPGKVMRLMAADVVAWHRATNGIDPDTKVWAALPRPWDVLLGAETCTRAEITAACVAAGIDPEASGWVKPRPRTAVDQVYDTPQTVHGVVVSHPQLATILRKAGWFSGYEKRVRETAPEIAEIGVAQRAAHAAAHGPKAHVVNHDESDESIW